MKQQPKLTPAGVFVPAAADQADLPESISSGRRRQFDPVDALPLRWPTTPKARFELFDAWHDVAMQILEHAKVKLRMAAVIRKVIHWMTGTITASNSVLASRAGFCDEKTISREIQTCINLGILTSSLEWRRPGGGKFITVRTLRPALPVNLPASIILPESEPLSLDNSGPDLGGVSLDNSGPTPLDRSGPATIEPMKRDSRDEAA